MFDMEKSQQMTDIIHGTIPYSGIEHAIISTPIFNRLHRILQSSLVFLTYPSNKVKRFEHSMGVMHIAGKIFFNSICNSSPEVLKEFVSRISDELIVWRKNVSFAKYSFVNTELRTKYSGKKILEAPVPENKVYNIYCPNNLQEADKFSYFVVFQAVRIAALLHDVGHLPYSHILEHALKKMYYEIIHQDEHTDAESTFLNIMKRFAEGEDEIHEEIGKLLVNNIRNTIIQSATDRSDPDLYFFLSTFDFAEKIIYATPSDNSIYSDLHLITASVLDADRLDYCTRDSYCSGINKATFLYDKLLNTYKLSKVSEDTSEKFYFCPSARLKNVVEDLLRRRVEIFTEINYHHRVHKHELLLEEVICALGVEELKAIDIIEDLPYSLPLNISSIWKLISKLNVENDWPEYQIIQLDDSWLDTLLKSKFFEKYKEEYLSLRENGNDVLWNRFDELISTNKRYHSFFKLTTDFQLFDKTFFLLLKKRENDVLKYSKFLGDKIISSNSYNDFFNINLSFVFNYCVEKLLSLNQYKDRFFSKFEEDINKAIKKENTNIENCLLRSCMFGFGYTTAKTPLYLLDRKDKPIKIEQLSSQLQTFQNERAISPIFHLYYLPHYETKYNIYSNIDFDKFTEILASTAVNTLFEVVEQLLEGPASTDF